MGFLITIPSFYLGYVFVSLQKLDLIGFGQNNAMPCSKVCISTGTSETGCLLMYSVLVDSISP